jgi:hypothetical protein
MPLLELLMHEMLRHLDRRDRRLGETSAVVQAVLQAHWQARDAPTARRAAPPAPEDDIAGTVIWPPPDARMTRRRRRKEGTDDAV